MNFSLFSDIMYYVLIGLGSLIINWAIYINSSTKNFKYYSMLSSFLITLGFLFGGLTTAFIAALIVFARNVAAYFEKDYTIIFLVLSLGVLPVTLNMNGIHNIFPIISVVIMTWAYFKWEVYGIKASILVTSSLWMIYLLIEKAYFPLILQSIGLFSILIFWFKSGLFFIKEGYLPKTN